MQQVKGSKMNVRKMARGVLRSSVDSMTPAAVLPDIGFGSTSPPAPWDP